MNPISMEKIYLDALAPGRHALIDSVSARDETRRRLLELGFTPGTLVDCLMRAPSGDPTAYRVRSAVIALRREDARKIRVRFCRGRRMEVAEDGG